MRGEYDGRPCRTVTSLFRTNPAGFLTHRKSPFLWSIGPLQAIKLNQSHGIVLGEFVGMQDGYGDQVEESSSDNEPGPSSSASVSMPISSRVAPRWASATESSTSFQPAMFTLPHRSIFSSGLPTSSISANTAQASMSSPSSLYPLSTLSSSNANRARRAARETPQAIIHRRSRSTQIQKYADDHSTSVEDGSVMRRHGIRPTSMAVSNLFATTNPNASRPPSFAESSTVSHYVRMAADSTADLPGHLYTRGLMNGKHSDITVHCFGTSYALHRLLLDRAPFFCSALSEPWFESTAKEITLHPEELDSNITQAAFELALRRIYGCADANEEDEHPIGLFATGCWLEMSDLIDVSVACILKQMAPYSLADCIKFVTSNYYGKHGEKILTAAKAMLCREGYEMLLKNFNGISAVLIRETISSDAFYVPGEWERWILSKKIFNRRVRARALNLGIINADNSLKVPRPRMSPHILRDQVACEPELELDTNIWIQLYADPEISPLYELLDTGIHYMHMSFEQLQHVKAEMDVLKMIPLVIETVISNALWQSMLLRQSVINATEADIELGFTEMVQDRDDLSRTITGESDQEILVNDATTQQEDQSEENSTQSEQSDNKPSQSPKYWIPVSDSAYQMGTGSEIISETICSQDRSTRTHSFDHIDTMGAGGFSNRIAEDTSPKVSNCPGPKLLYTKFPPFRFAAEFPPTKSLKENETVYSNTVWYAGSLWNVYIQKQETLKNTQLGIYLHREKHLAGAEDFMRNVAQSTHVDERISSIEKELYLRQRTRRRLDNVSAQPLGDGYDFYADLLRSRMPPDLDTISGLLRPRSSIPRSSEGGQARDQPLNTAGAFNREKDETKNLGNTIRKPALPIYVDSRSIIKTYFKIYAPSRGGRMMSVYESAPDQFNFSRNLGWKSTNLVVDDNTDVSEDGISSNEPRLRFMFVIGNV